jgi:hypothetical protein
MIMPRGNKVKFWQEMREENEKLEERSQEKEEFHESLLQKL